VFFKDYNNNMNKRVVTSDPSLPFSEVVISNGMAYVSGQVSIDSEANLVEGGIEEQTKVTLENLKTVLEKAGLGLENVVRTGCYLLSRKDLAGFAEVYGQYFTSEKPARSTVFISSLPIEGTIVEIDCVATVE
jgi:2-iminobutanoate/2-iminopropanoate deaminase